MKKIIDYTVVAAIDTGNLIDLVFEHIEEGWEPFGAVVLAYERNIHRELGPNDKNLPNDFEHWAQALVKYEQSRGPSGCHPEALVYSGDDDN